MNDWLYHYAATVLKVVDGDTIDIRIELGLNVSTVERCRLYGIDAPETRGESRQAGLESKQWLEDNLPGKIFIKTHKDKTGKYGRYLIDVFLMATKNCPAVAGQCRTRWSRENWQYDANTEITSGCTS